MAPIAIDAAAPKQTLIDQARWLASKCQEHLEVQAPITEALNSQGVTKYTPSALVHLYITQLCHVK